ncbi:hypothetical protein COEREDRAFT_6256 [Coemansia reversa NRRL 1564]|uniref:Uncharacterized protein n=1 Tax=Coemansia reversa (strain ATCC 12441 / NRRL 1564) TaxID=763665 RepID=A0A2G5BHT1_COERN|nr:hypothetical protein COEREDRAFT_6256 [Coemansia reversa NRRL 1564]|eukprot:PIA18541.1 hypothetical protein COEREDRAFT_6256 [Coemansia reversa NRRL 1564]
MSTSINPKHLLSDHSKLRILCVMFEHFALTRNGISILANPGSENFRALAENVIQFQPNLRGLGDGIIPVLESFISNQNSRLFCALADLYMWYKSGKSFEIMQLTLKHVHSLFKRPPYERRPYTRELTYAQRTIILYHARDMNTWIELTNAYAALYESEFECEWKEKHKFLHDGKDPLPIPAEMLQIIYSLTPTTGVFEQQQHHQATCSGQSSPSRVGTPVEAGASIGLGSKSSKVIKRRAMSAASKTKTARVLALAEYGKQRSMSIAGGGGGGAGMLTKSLSAPSAQFMANQQALSTPNWPSSVAPTECIDSQNQASFAEFLRLNTGPQQLTQSLSAQTNNTLVDLDNAFSSESQQKLMQQLHQTPVTPSGNMDITQTLGIGAGIPSYSNSSIALHSVSSSALQSQMYVSATPKDCTQPTSFNYNQFFMNSPQN